MMESILKHRAEWTTLNSFICDILYKTLLLDQNNGPKS